RSSEAVLLDPRAVHQLVRAGDQRAERTPEALREAQRRSVEPTSELGRGNLRRDGCVHQPRSVQVRTKTELVRDVDDLAELVQRPARAAGRVVRVLDGYHGQGRRPELAVLPHGLTYLQRGEASAEPRQPSGLQARMERGAAELRGHDVGPLLDEQLAAPGAEDG